MHPTTTTYPEEVPMASHSLLQGVVTHLDRLSTTSGQMRNGHGQIQTNHATIFRLDNQPVLYEAYADLTVGDPATASGRVKNGQFCALAVRNDSTHLVYGQSMTGTLVLAGILVLVGLLTMPFGVIPLIAGGLLGRYAYAFRQAREMLRGGRNAPTERVLT